MQASCSASPIYIRKIYRKFFCLLTDTFMKNEHNIMIIKAKGSLLLIVGGTCQMVVGEFNVEKSTISYVVLAGMCKVVITV